MFVRVLFSSIYNCPMIPRSESHSCGLWMVSFLDGCRRADARGDGEHGVVGVASSSMLSKTCCGCSIVINDIAMVLSSSLRLEFVAVSHCKIIAIVLCCDGIATLRVVFVGQVVVKCRNEEGCNFEWKLGKVCGSGLGK